VVTRLGKHHGRGHQDDALDFRSKPLGAEDGERAPEARAHERHRRFVGAIDFARQLIEHARHRQQSKIGLVEVGAQEADAARAKALGEVRRLRGFRR
jgi:hypothetical protein